MNLNTMSGFLQSLRCCDEGCVMTVYKHYGLVMRDKEIVKVIENLDGLSKNSK